MVDPAWLDEHEFVMWRSFFYMRRDLERALEAQLAEHGLSHADYTVLVVLSETEGTVMRVRDLGEQISWESSRLAHHLRRMEQRGLLVRSDALDDRRGTLVTLTPAGLAAIREAAPGHVDAVRRYFVDLLDANEIEMLASISQRVSAAVKGVPLVETRETAAAAAEG
ncbi:MAG: winged helix-turn-helix transcriptional regulator [Kineosporiaceae bacterium]|nr:winged helix-turn-helix transcriptional regulator [Kineosporiaceae bacterium]MBK7621940.1 winged helix-turn-helix transcriptional regulator [Kineosporiaceae bacterium]MBK8074254.1 winged helix-turn-helix transcriptional regulator [Kineosporiaceae bacterium]